MERKNERRLKRERKKCEYLNSERYRQKSLQCNTDKYYRSV